MDIKASTFFTKEQQEQIRAAIKEAEEATSGEIRVHIETSLTGDVLDRAAEILAALAVAASVVVVPVEAGKKRRAWSKELKTKSPVG